MRKIFIVDGGYEYDKLFLDRGWDIVDMEEAEIVCFTGGEDVDPNLYGHKRHRTTYTNMLRDVVDQRIYRKALQKDIPMVGICRGAQFLNVMCGGKLYQDVTKHAIAAGHKLFDQLDGDVLDVTSTHHQMMMPSPKALTIAVGKQHGVRTFYNPNIENFETEESDQDYEVVLYEAESCLCFQPHPEFLGDRWYKMRDYFFRCIDTYLF